MAQAKLTDIELDELACIVAQLYDVAARMRSMARMPWPELPNGEGVDSRMPANNQVFGPTGLTESETEQVREEPPTCDPKGGEGAGYHPGSSADPRD